MRTVEPFKARESNAIPYNLQVLRSIRVWAPRLAKPLAELELGKAQLGLAHSYSRAKVKFNVNRVDNMIIQVRPKPSSRTPPNAGSRPQEPEPLAETLICYIVEKRPYISQTVKIYYNECDIWD